MATPTSVEDYLAALPEESRAALEKLRKTIKAAIGYQMPALKGRRTREEDRQVAARGERSTQASLSR